MLYLIGNAFLIFLVIAETIANKIFEKENFNLKEVLFNINSGHITLWCIRGIEIGGYNLLLHSINMHIIDQLHPVLIWVFTIFAWDLCFYWYHRIHHKYSWLWGIHVVHHEGEEYNLSLGLRNSWYSALTTIPFFAVLAILGVPFEVYIIVSVLHYFIQFWNHNSWFQDYGFLNFILTSPSHHKVHHGKQSIYLNKNFGGTFNIWDKLFNTFKEEVEGTPVDVGTSKPFKSYDVIKANNQYFFKILGYKIKESMPSQYKVNEVLLTILGCGKFCVFLHYVHYEDLWSIAQKLAIFSVAFIGTVAIGKISEGRWIGLWIWTINIIVWMPIIGMTLLTKDSIWIYLNIMLFVGSLLLYPSIRTQNNPVNNQSIN